MTAQTKFLIKTAKYMLFDHNINHDILKDNKTQLIIEKKNYKCKCLHVHRMDRSRLTHVV
jgi:hypothetical protein